MLDLVRQFLNQLSYANLRYAQALDGGGLHKRRQKKCLRYLRKLCGTLGILPSSFILEPTFDEREHESFAQGGFSYVYKAATNGRPVVIKTLKVTTTADPKKVHRVSSLVPRTPSSRSRSILSFSSKRSLDGSGFDTITSYHLLVSHWHLRFCQSYRNGWRMGTSWNLSRPFRIIIACAS